MAVSNTYTLEATWGSRIVVQGAGFILNNEMGDFNWFPVRRTPLVELELNPISCKVGSGCSAHSALLFSNVMGSW